MGGGRYGAAGGEERDRGDDQGFRGEGRRGLEEDGRGRKGGGAEGFVLYSWFREETMLLLVLSAFLFLLPARRDTVSSSLHTSLLHSLRRLVRVSVCDSAHQLSTLPHGPNEQLTAS